MEIKIKSKHIAGIIFGIIIIMLDFYFFFSLKEGITSRWFRPFIVVGIVSMGMMFFLDFLNENKRQKELELKFLEFVRALVETVRGGVPVPKAIVQISNENYAFFPRLATSFLNGIFAPDFLACDKAMAIFCFIGRLVLL